jgi:hydantoinase/carbamoylase family amidase
MSDIGRVLSRLGQIYALGGGRGANRPAFSSEEDAAHELATAWMCDAGLEVTADQARNLYGRLRGLRPELPEVWSGSHLDSVPQGGRFDGPLGVVAALEAIERVGQQERTLTVVAFRDEEGSRFGRGCFGSRALAGQLEAGEFEARDAEGVALGNVVACSTSGWLDARPRAFVEVHVEQGPVLAERDVPLGVVTSIVGLARLETAFEGEAGHAGTTPMFGRADALVAASDFVLRVRDAALAHPGAVATVGRLQVEPNAANVIPSRVTLIVDARAPEEETLSSLLDAIGRGTVLRRTKPAPMADEPRAALRAAINELAVPVVELHSGAGHDAGVMASAGVPSAMLFVRSRHGGVSHSPDEHSDDADVAIAVDALERALRTLARA